MKVISAMITFDNGDTVTVQVTEEGLCVPIPKDAPPLNEQYAHTIINEGLTLLVNDSNQLLDQLSAVDWIS